MRINMMTSGFIFLSMTAFANSPVQNPDLGNEQTYTVDGMKEKCKLFQGSSQLKPFSIRVECSKIESRWDAVPGKRPLPQWVEYTAAGTGKGHIQEETAKQNLAPQEYECVNYQEKTILSKGYIEATCEEFVQGVKDLTSLCRDGVMKKDGSAATVEWVQVGEPELGTLSTDGCDTDIKDIGPGQIDQR